MYPPIALFICIQIPQKRYLVALYGLQHCIAARKVVVNIVGNQARLKIAAVAQRIGRTGNI